MPDVVCETEEIVARKMGLVNPEVERLAEGKGVEP